MNRLVGQAQVGPVAPRASRPLESGLLTGAFTHERAAGLPATDWRATAPLFTGARLDRSLALVSTLRPITA
ncbi:hypothetical protein [Dactylosporangium sp. NPDC051541]|uniref:hypothetical protein n=1 Tax=Dactylosporangium sp. NPDC051541 TaxID=3363977 RepID=UPI0037AF2C8D